MDQTALTDLPRYLAVAGDIEQAIRSGELTVGERLPSERDIARDQQISRVTARHALQHLTRLGLIEAQVGRGTFVRATGIRQELTTLTGFSEEMGRQGRTTSSIVIEALTGEPDPRAMLVLNLNQGALVHRLTRVRLVDHQPLAIESSDIVADMAPGFLDGADFAQISTYARLRKVFGIQPTTAEQTLEAAAATGETMHRLNLPEGAPVLRLTRLTCDAAGRPFEYVRSVYRGDAFSMKVSLTVKGERP